MLFHKIKLSQLKDNLVEFQKITDLRFVILLLNLYSEHFVNDFIKIKSGEIIEKEIRKKIGFPSKLRILKELGWINEDEKRILEVFNSIRDEFVHNLIIDHKKLNGTLKSFAKRGSKAFDFVVNENPKIKKIFEKISPLEKFKTSMIWIIYKLWLKLQVRIKQPINEKIELRPGKDRKIYVHFFELKRGGSKT